MFSLMCDTKQVAAGDQTFIVSCPETRWEGIWSPAEAGSFVAVYL